MAYVIAEPCIGVKDEMNADYYRLSREQFAEKWGCEP